MFIAALFTITKLWSPTLMNGLRKCGDIYLSIYLSIHLSNGILFIYKEE
jgi:hypothetical protein